MSIDEDDLERAGTRSRRQLSNSRQYSVYPPENPLHDIKKSNSLNKRPRSVILISITILILFILFLANTSRTSTTELSNQKTSTFEETTEFKESKQLTDYALLHKLFNEKNGAVSSSRVNFNNLDAINPGQNSFVHRLSKGAVLGHTFDELRRLTNSISLPTTLPAKQHRRVPVTAIIHTKTVTQLYIQVQSVLTQTALPEHIWILCDTNQKAEVDARIMTLDRRRVTVMARDNIDSIPHKWLQVMGHISTDFVWLIDQDIVPGKRYLENLLKLSLTKQYKSSLLGTEAAVLNTKYKDRIECIPTSMNSGSRQMKSQVVDMINDSWLLHRSWVPFILEEIEKGNTNVSLEPLTGLFISRILYMNAGIPSIALPTDPIERAYWGDVRLQKSKKSETCKAIERFIKNQDMKSLPIYDNLFYRNNGYRTVSTETTTSTAAPIFIYMDSMQALENLVTLVCKFESKEDVDVHVVVGGIRKLSDLQVKVYLPHACDKSVVNVIVHDISVLHTSSNWEAINSLLHRLTRIMSVIQPKVLIHNIDKENAFYSSIQSASKISDVTTIYLPVGDIPHALWITELPVDTLSKWNAFSIKILINTDKKPHALARLLNSATNAYYLGDNVELSILMDHSTDQLTQTFVTNFIWKRGTKNVRHRIAQAGKSHLFAEAWYPASNDEYGIVLSNDVELSKYYYIWAKYTILKYRYVEAEKTMNMFGISLYRPPLIETDPSGRYPFNPNQVLSKAGFAEKMDQPFLMQWPSYSGAIFFPEHWREFHDYITARTADVYGFDMQDITIPDLRSNEWVKSWRRYFEELIYLRSYTMLYPNFKESLSTQHVELRKKTMREEFENAIAVYNVPLMDQTDEISTLKLPSFDDLPVLDIWGQVTNHQELKDRGLELHDEISSCPAPLEEENQYDPTDLLCPFARIVTLSVNDENDPLPELPPLEVTVYN
ncbi:hypothetical protein EDC94DRAFT_579707 [Helicostylum pulchrum]|nr:hypothetical protein EDC94DRAFT_579707 [Helicostylum pulchrum]